MGRKNILIVDDDPDFRNMFSDILKINGYTPLVTDTGRSALDMVKAEVPSIALIDLKLEDMSGLEVLRELKAYSPGTMCILITGYASQESAIEAVNMGAYSYVTKPFDTEQLLVMIRRAIEKQEADEALRESEEKFRTICASAQDAILMMDNEGNISYWNEAAERIFGYLSEEVLGQDLHMLLAPQSYQEAFRKGFSRFKKIGRGRSDGKILELQAVKKDGTNFPIELSVSAKKLKGNWNATAIIRDITERKQAVETLKREKEKLRVLVEESPLGVSLTDKEGNYKYVNPKFVEMFGYSLEDIPTGRECFYKPYPDPEHGNHVVSTWINDQKKSAIGEARSRSFNATCKDGSQKIIRFISVTLETGDQFIIYEDLTEEKKLQAQLMQSQKMEAMGRISGGIAHDFNNIMTSVIGFSTLALMALKKDDPLRKNVEEIKKSGERAASLTRQLLAFSRKQVLQPRVLDLNKVLIGIDKMLRQLIGEDVVLKRILKTDLRRVKGNPGQMEQVIMNLAINAKDAMPKGGTLTIETADVDLDADYFRGQAVKDDSGPYVMLAVSDTGLGMDDETKSQIFDPFFTTKKKGKGTGLGLSTVYGIVKQSRGYIWTNSEVGRGTTFKVYLPRVEIEAESTQKEHGPEELLHGSGCKSAPL